MAKFLNSHGVEVSQADAMIGGALRPGFKKILEDGESIHMNITMLDSMRLPTAKLADEKRQREVTDMLRKARYSGYGSFIEAADGENPVRPTIPSGMSPTDATAYLRKARYAQ